MIMGEMSDETPVRDLVDHDIPRSPMLARAKSTPIGPSSVTSPFTVTLGEETTQSCGNLVKFTLCPDDDIAAMDEALHTSEIKLSELQRPTCVPDILFDLLCDPIDKKVSVRKFWAMIERRGLRMSDPRFEECRIHFKEKQYQQADLDTPEFKVDRDTFRECVNYNISLINRVFKDDLIIPEFYNFIPYIENIYTKCKRNHKGHPASYIPQLARVDPRRWGVSVCSLDGQRCSFGDTEVPFCIQSCSKPLTYALAVSELGADTVHSYVGLEPSGRSFNELTLDHNHKPHNPMINAGAIITACLVNRKQHIADRFDYVFKQYKELAGGEYVGFSNSVYLSERCTADRNFALGYYMREKKCFPENADLKESLEFYFQLCSIEITADSGSVIAATLANGGVCPITGRRVLDAEAVRNTLSLMYTCGMYDYSGEFAFKVGLPAKSGVAGAVLLVVPKIMGICIWGPPLDNLGNSCRAVQFCENLVSVFNFHNYDDLTESEHRKVDPRRRNADNAVNSIVNLLFAAANADMASIHRFALSGTNMSAADYDGRTALHLAAAEGHLEIVEMLLMHCHVNPEPHDRWNFTPLDDAKKFNHPEVARYLIRFIEENK